MNLKQTLSIGLLGLLGCEDSNAPMQAEAAPAGNQYSVNRVLSKNEEVEIISEARVGERYGFTVKDKDNKFWTFGTYLQDAAAIDSRIDKGDIIKIRRDLEDGEKISYIEWIEVIKKASQ